ncbi:DUF998 domain-containing protein [Agromyces sp. Root81]|uniref:DUF998 domain-containing protein n=1 Tax=Agromyces sp. Root81 TaxID=1736601 RepID=UPI0009ECB4DC
MPSTRILLAAGVAIAPIFLAIALAQMALRPGFDITRHAVSSLTNGDLGWVQTLNFVVTGALAILFAVGVVPSSPSSPHASCSPAASSETRGHGPSTPWSRDCWQPY